MVKEVKSDLYKHPGIPKYVGKMSNLNKFDAQFFRVTPWQAASLDPLTRKAMENAYGAIYDSGKFKNIFNKHELIILSPPSI